MALCLMHIQVATHSRTFTRTKMHPGIRRESVARAACNVHRLFIVRFFKPRRVESKTTFCIISRIHAVDARLCKLPDGFSNANIGRFSERILIINVRMAGGRRFAEQVSNFRASGIKYALTEFRFFEKLLHLKCMGSYVTLPTDNFTIYCSYTVRRGTSSTFSLLLEVYY